MKLKTLHAKRMRAFVREETISPTLMKTRTRKWMRQLKTTDMRERHPPRPKSLGPKIAGSIRRRVTARSNQRSRMGRYSTLSRRRRFRGLTLGPRFRKIKFPSAHQRPAGPKPKHTAEHVYHRKRRDHRLHNGADHSGPCNGQHGYDNHISPVS